MNVRIYLGLPVIRLIYSESKQCDSQRPIFSYADFFRSHTALRGNAPGITESGGYFAFDTGDKAAESFIVRVADGICMDSDCSNSSIHGYLRRNSDPIF